MHLLQEKHVKYVITYFQITMKFFHKIIEGYESGMDGGSLSEGLVW